MVGVDGLVKQLSGQKKDISSSAGYSLIPVHAWTHNVSDVVRAIQALEVSPEFVFDDELPSVREVQF